MRSLELRENKEPKGVQTLKFSAFDSHRRFVGPPMQVLRAISFLTESPGHKLAILQPRFPSRPVRTWYPGQPK